MDPVAKPLVGCAPSPFTYTACDRAQTLFYSAAITANCPVGTTGEPVTVQAGRFTSTTSQADADAQAQNHLTALIAQWCTPGSGDQPAYYQSAAVTGTCPGAHVLGGPFTILAGQYSSTVSQADADAQAAAHLATLLSMFCIPDPAFQTFTIAQVSTYNADAGSYLENYTQDYTYSGVTDLAILRQTYGLTMFESASVPAVTDTRTITVKNIEKAVNITILDGALSTGNGGTQSVSMSVAKNGTVVNTQTNTTLSTDLALTTVTVAAAPGDVVTITFTLTFSGIATGELSAESRLQVTYQ